MSHFNVYNCILFTILGSSRSTNALPNTFWPIRQIFCGFSINSTPQVLTISIEHWWNTDTFRFRVKAFMARASRTWNESFLVSKLRKLQIISMTIGNRSSKRWVIGKCLCTICSTLSLVWVIVVEPKILGATLIKCWKREFERQHLPVVSVLNHAKNMETHTFFTWRIY